MPKCICRVLLRCVLCWAVPPKPVLSSKTWANLSCTYKVFGKSRFKMLPLHPKEAWCVCAMNLPEAIPFPGVSCSRNLRISHATAHPLHLQSHKNGWNIWVSLTLIIKCCTSVPKYSPWATHLGVPGVSLSANRKFKKCPSLTTIPQLFSPGLCLRFHADGEFLPALFYLTSFFLDFFQES